MFDSDYDSQHVVADNESSAIHGYYPLAQSKTSNQLIQNLARKNNFFVNEGGDRTLELEGFVLTIQGAEGQQATVHNAAAVLLDCLIIKATENGLKDARVELPLLEYKEMRGLIGKDDKDLRKRITRDIETLTRVRFRYYYTGRRENTAWRWVDIYGGEAAIVNSKIIFKFSEEYFESIRASKNKYMFMHYPCVALRANLNDHPYTFYLGRRLTLHWHMNLRKPNQGVIGVETLIKDCPNFPVYEDIERQLNQRMIQPFIRDMNALNPTMTWNFCETNNKIGIPKTYLEFVNAKICFQIHEYPSTDKLIEGRRKREQRIKSSREKRK